MLAAALATLEGLRDKLSNYQPFYAAHAAVLARAGELDGARRAYARAIALADQASDRLFLLQQLHQIGGSVQAHSGDEILCQNPPDLG